KIAQASVAVTRDSIPPAIDLVAPPMVSKARPGRATADVRDASGVADVTFRIDGATPTTLTSPPFAADLPIPAQARDGDTFALTVEAQDGAGNLATVTRGINVGADGVIVGHVLSDATGLPIAAASVHLDAGSPTTTDDTGRYVLPAQTASAVVRVDKDGMT